MKVRTNYYGQPVFTDQQNALVHAELISRPCEVCDAPAGSNCRISNSNHVHMGRLPDGFDSINFIESLEDA